MKIPTLVLLLFLLIPPPLDRDIIVYAAARRWDFLLSNIGIPAMHMQLLHTDRVLIFDRTDFGKSNISLPAGKCTTMMHDCTAHSVEYDVRSNTVRPLMVLTDVWCSSAAATADGTVVQTGGFRLGNHVVRIYKPCWESSCDWEEIPNGLAEERWYATNHILPDGGMIIIGGRRQFNYEYYPKRPTEKSYNLPFLSETNDPWIENNLYPFVFLNVDGNLFIFANNRAILYDYAKMVVVKSYPTIPGGDPRNYPSTGSAVLLPLKNNTAAEVLLCGGAPKGAYTSARDHGTFLGALNTCGRIRINDPNPQWVMETMPMGRVMGDMVLLPNGNVLIINGAASGTAGWELGRNPVLNPVIYRPDIGPVGSRFEVQNPSTIPRMYHSTALLLRDGRVLIGGSDPHKYYRFTGVLFPTDLSLEAFSPSYLDPTSANLRPKIISPFSQSIIGYEKQLDIQFYIPQGIVGGAAIVVTMLAPSFNTHSFSMNQRLLVLSGGNVTVVGNSTFWIRVVTPVSSNFAPAGYYLLFVVHGDIPSKGIWIQIK
ncbi:aldehyde oxidase GLOX1-like [Primulina huaijiensis]|uniref:aldehyde oxidase GLOX1-like n=1 Tax=Primulina huaijiensis TaxID=1492673 RepID=UPI003CC731AA